MVPSEWQVSCGSLEVSRIYVTVKIRISLEDFRKLSVDLQNRKEKDILKRGIAGWAVQISSESLLFRTGL